MEQKRKGKEKGRCVVCQPQCHILIKYVFLGLILLLLQRVLLVAAPLLWNSLLLSLCDIITTEIDMDRSGVGTVDTGQACENGKPLSMP